MGKSSTVVDVFPNDLGTLLHPLPEGVFFDTYYGQKPVLIEETTRGRSRPPLSLETADALVQCLCWKFGREYSLVRTAKVMPDIFAPQCEGKPVATWLAQKWSLVLNKVCNEVYPVHCLVNDLSPSLSSRVWTNAYYTPAGGQCFDWHADKHDVFIWQLQGVKAWKVTGPSAHPADEIPLIEALLRPGQLLYIPEGFAHVAETVANEDSLHLTIAFESRSSQALQILRSSLDQWARPESLAPRRFIAEASGVDGRIGTSKLEALDSVEAFRSWLAQNMADWNVAREQPPQRHLPTTATAVVDALGHLTPECRLALIEPCAIERGDGEHDPVQFGSESGKIAFRSAFGDALTHVSSCESFCASELPLDIMQLSLCLCRTLVATGMARVVDGVSHQH